MGEYANKWRAYYKKKKRRKRYVFEEREK